MSDSMTAKREHLPSLPIRSKRVDWEVIYRTEMPRLYNFLRYRLHDELVAEDLTAVTFEKAWRYRHIYRPHESAFTTWLFTIARNSATDGTVVVSNIMPGITITWVDDTVRGRAFSLDVGNAHPEVNLRVGPDSVTEVMIHDLPATLIRGGWYQNTQRWEEDGPRALRWQANGIEFILSTMMAEWGGLSEEELIQIAESIPQE